MIKIFNFILITSIGATCYYGCGKIKEKSLRTANKCDISSISNRAAINRVYDGCDLDLQAQNAIPEAQSVVSVNVLHSGDCTGTFIGNNSILTAAHCFKNRNDLIKVVSSLSHDFNNLDSTDIQYYLTEASVAIHPYFLENCLNHKPNNITEFNKCNFADFAVLKTIKSAQEINATVAKVTLTSKPDERVIFVGYGKKVDNESNRIRTKHWGISYLYNPEGITFSDKKITAPNGDQMSVIQFYEIYIKKYILPPFQDDPRKSFLFTKGLENENGICQGDSGGPVFVRRGTELATAGVVHANSGGEQNICEYKQSIDMNIGAYFEWVKTEVEKNGDTINIIN